MLIGIDASRYSYTEATGVEWYGFYIINNLIKSILTKKEDDVIFYAKHPLAFPKEIHELINKNTGRIKTKIIKNKRLWTLSGLSKIMKAEPPDVLFVPSHVLPLKLPKKSVITIHDTAFKYLKKSYSFLQYKYLNWSTKYAVKNATRIIVPSEATKNDLINFFKCPKDKINVVYHGFSSPEINQTKIDEIFKTSDFFKYFGIKKDSSYILFVGRLESKKNLSRLVQAFNNFSKLHPEYRLILAGKRGIGFEDIIKTVNKLKIANKVIMPGYVTEDEKFALLKYCKIFALPSLYEGFGLPILEAFYFKKTILTSHVSCLPEVCGEAAHYIDPYDADDISNGLEKLTNDSEYAKRLIDLGEERLKLFSWERSAKETLDVLKS